VTIHAAPIPTLRALCLAAVGPSRNSWAPWLASARERNAEFYSAGRFALNAGIVYALERRGKTHGLVWLPDYLCDEAVIPLRAEALRLYFYPITKDLSPDWERIHSDATSVGSPDVFILVHYFGFRNCVAEAKAFCSTHQAELIEDCAHVLVPVNGCGEGTAVFSPRKLLPVPEGGLLVTTDATKVSQPTENFGSNKAFIVKWVARRMAQRLLLTLSLSWHKTRKGGIAARRDDQAAPPSERVTSLPDRFSARLLEVLARDLDSVIRKRRDNYLRLLQAIAGFEEVTPLFPSLPDDVCPYAFPLVVPQGRDALDGQLQKCGVPSCDWPNLPAEVIDRLGRHHTAIWLQEHILLLPVHQDLSDKQMEYMARQLRSFLMTKAA